MWYALRQMNCLRPAARARIVSFCCIRSVFEKSIILMSDDPSKKNNSNVIPFNSRRFTFPKDEVETQAALLMQNAQLYFTMGAALYGYLQMHNNQEVTPDVEANLLVLLQYIRSLERDSMPSRKKISPVVRDFPVGNRIVRKTVDQLAHELLPKLEKLGLTATHEEVLHSIRSGVEDSILSTIILHWVGEEQRRGIEIV